MLPTRQRGQRWLRMSPAVASFVAVPIVISPAAIKLTDGGVPLSVPSFDPVDFTADFVIICDYTGKEVVE